jgi:outer membrane protein assembly factor BamB
MRPAALLPFACALSCAIAPAPVPVVPPPPPPPARAPTLALAELAVVPSPTSPVPCGADGWATYAHDAARTSASGACLRAPLSPSWRFVPRSRGGREARVAHAVVDGDDVYAEGTLGDAPALWKLSAPTGEVVWTFDSRADIAHLMWPTLAPRTVLLVDDGIFLVDPETGKNRGRELDAWGESLTDGTSLFVMNTWQADGLGPYVGALDLDGRSLWRRDLLRHGRGYRPPDVGGFAMADGVLVHASNQAQRGAHVVAFAPAGDKKWRTDTTTPESSPSLSQGRVLMVERWPGEKIDRLVARSLKTGVVAWSTEMKGARGPAPVAARGLVIVHGEGGVSAFDEATGEPRWSSPVPRTTLPSQSATTLAAALGTGDLAVCAGGRVHVLALDDGRDEWSGEATPGAKSVDSPALAGGALYVVADGALLRLGGYGQN